MQQPSIDLEQEFHVGQLVELQASLCTAPCEQDCGCREQVARNGHVGEIVAVHTPMFGGAGYYQVDGLDWLIYGDELRAVQS